MLCLQLLQILADYLRPYIEQLDQMRTSRSEEPPSDAVVRLSTAMVVIYIMINHGIPVEEKVANILCDALLLRTPGEDHSCHDFEAVNKNFPECKVYVLLDILGIVEKNKTVFSKSDCSIVTPEMLAS